MNGQLLRRPGPLALALAMIGDGVLFAATRNLGLVGLRVPLPRPDLVACAFGLFLLLAGAGLFIASVRRTCGWGLVICASLWVAARSPEVLRHPLSAGAWESLCEALALFAGLSLLAAHFSREAGQRSRLTSRLTSKTALHLAQALFGFSCVIFGVAHFAYAEFTAALIPTWLPAHLPLTYATGLAHAAAGVAILVRRWARKAASLEGIMLGLFVLIVHLPSLWQTPAPKWASTVPERWAELLIALSIAGAAGTVADSLRGE